MKKRKVLFVFGTRPEALKLAPVIREARQRKKFKTLVCLTAQHREMLDQVLDLFEIRADFDMKVMRKGQSLSDLTRRILPKMQDILHQTKPDLMVVQGDTTTAFLVSLAAFYEHCPIAHIEAGLRSHQKEQPFPEEINRVLISHLADFHFAPTPPARQNLLREGVPEKNIFVTGNTIVDTFQWMKATWNGYRSPLLESLPPSKKLVLVTAHRRESFGKPLRSICKALKTLVAMRDDIVIVYPVHLNPDVQKIVSQELRQGMGDRIRLIEPVPYQEFLALMDRAYVIVTDSGGIQEEAPSLGKPVLVIREVSERQEGLASGIAKLIGTSRDRIVEEVQRLLQNRSAYLKMIKKSNPYGDGKASRRILSALEKIIP